MMEQEWRCPACDAMVTVGVYVQEQTGQIDIAIHPSNGPHRLEVESQPTRIRIVHPQFITRPG